MTDGIAPSYLADIAARLPSGYNIADLRLVDTEAVITTDVDDEVSTVLASVKVAAPQMINSEGRPTVLKIVKWMCHGEQPNGNGDMFVGAELERLAPTLFREPNFGVMDWDHSAVLQQEGAPPLIGVWYKADWAYHAKAYDGAGAWGMLVSGVLFAWLYPDIADQLLAEQARYGVIKGSMACVPSSVEVTTIAGRSTRILHNPVFFTHSLLSKAPADPSAVGVGSEDPAIDTERLKEDCLTATQDEPLPIAQDDVPEDDTALVVEQAADGLTHFPVRGENRPVHLRYSQYRVAPLAMAEELRQHWPELWEKGGNVLGTAQFNVLSPLLRAGGKARTTETEQAVRLREAWAARHRGDHRLPGVVAQLKWLVVSDRGLDHMKRVITEAKDAVRAQRAAQAVLHAASLKEATMDEELMTQLEAANEALLAEKLALEARVSELSAALEQLAATSARVTELETKLAEVEAELAKSKAKKGPMDEDEDPEDSDDEMMDAKHTAIQTELDEAITAKNALMAELQTLQGALADALAKLEGYATQEAARAEEAAERAKVARLAARIAELPEPYRVAHAKREETVRTRIETHWAALTEDEWELKKEELVGGFAPTKAHFVARSLQDGVLPVVEQSDALRSKIASHIK